MDALGPISDRRRLLSDGVFERVGRAIVDGTLPAGSRLRDGELAHWLNVSRTPVREAMQRLERIGLVTILPSRYTLVTIVTAETVRMSRECAGFHAGIAARMGAERMDAAQRARALELIDDLEAVIDDPVATSTARRAFYSFLSSCADNALHDALLHDVELALERNLAHDTNAVVPRDQVAENYAALRRGIQERHSAEVERLVRAQHGITD